VEGEKGGRKGRVVHCAAVHSLDSLAKCGLKSLQTLSERTHHKELRRLKGGQEKRREKNVRDSEQGKSPPIEPARLLPRLITDEQVVNHEAQGKYQRGSGKKQRRGRKGERWRGMGSKSVRPRAGLVNHAEIGL